MSEQLPPIADRRHVARATSPCWRYRNSRHGLVARATGGEPPFDGPPMSGPPMSGPPMSGPPMSGPPVSGPPHRDDGGPPGPPVSRRPYRDDDGGPPPRPKGRWRRILVRTLLTLLFLALALRLAVHFALNPTLRRVGEAYGVDISFERRQLTLLGGDVGLWGLKIKPKHSDKQLVNFDYVRGYVSPWQLLRGRLHVLRAEADGVDLVIERTPDGRIPLLDTIANATASKPGAPVKIVNPNERPRPPLDFTSPLNVEAFRVNHVRARVIDNYVQPALDALVSMDLRINYLGDKQRPTHFEIDAWSDPVLDSLRIYGDSRNEGQYVDAVANVFVRGLHPRPLEQYLRSMGIRPVGDNVALDMDVAMKTAPMPDPTRGVTASLLVSGIDVVCDSQRAGALRTLRIEADELSPTAASISSVVVENGVLNATRSPNGLINIAGFELAGAPPAPSSTAEVAAPIPPRPATAPKRFSISVRDVQLRDLAANLRDFTVSPPNEIRVALSEAGSSTAGINPDDPNAVVPIRGAMSMPGIANSVHFEGSAKPFAPTRTFDVKFAAEGVKPDALQPYLQSASLESLLRDARIDGQLTGALHGEDPNNPLADARITGLRLSDGKDVFVLDDLNITGAGTDPATGRLKIASFEAKGPTLDVTRDSEGRISTAGFRYTPPSASRSPTRAALAAPATSPVTLPTSSQPAVASLPRIEVGRFAWTGLKLRVRDELVQPVTAVNIDDAGIELRDFLLDMQHPDLAAKTGTLRAWLKSPELARSLTVDGAVRPGRNAVDLDLNLSGTGINTQVLAAYLKPLGIEPLIRDGSVVARLSGNVSQPTADSLTANLGLSTVRLADGDRVLGGIDELRVDALNIRPGRTDADLVRVLRPQIDITRQADGAFVLLGGRIRPSSSAAPSAVAASAATRPTSPQPAASQPAVAGASGKGNQPASGPSQPGLKQSPVASLRELRVEGAQVHWTDQTAPRPVLLAALADAQLAGLSLGQPGAGPAKFKLTLSADETLGEMVVDGIVDPNPDAMAVKAAVAARGVRAGALAPYLPPGIELNTTDGRLNADIDAGLATNATGGRSARLSIDKVTWRDAGGNGANGAANGAGAAPNGAAANGGAPNGGAPNGGAPNGGAPNGAAPNGAAPNGAAANANANAAPESPLLAFDSFKLIAPNIDLDSANVIAIDELSLTGLRTDIQIDADGNTRAMGVTLLASPPTTAPAAPATAPAMDERQQQETLARLIAEARKPLPLITLERLNLQIAQASFRDLRKPNATPLALQDVQLTNPQRIELGGPDAETRPPLNLQVTGKANPIIDRFTVNTIVAPLAVEPVGTIDIAAGGIRGTGITDLLPDLREKLDGSGLTDGQFKAQLQFHAKLDRHGPRDWAAFSKPFVLDFTLARTEFRDGTASSDTPVLAALESMRAEQVKVDSKNGTVLAKSVEITKPAARAFRDDQGIHALGILIPMKSSTSQPSSEPSTEPALASEQQPPGQRASSSVAESATTKPSGEIRIDRLTVSGLDLRVEDRTVSPPLVIPLNNLDLDARGLTTLALSEPRAIRFDAVVNADKIPLPPKPKGAGGGIPGAILAGALAKKEEPPAAEQPTTEPATEDRELFAQIAANGNLSFFPQPAGYVKAAINGVELAAFKSTAAARGVKLDSGILDATIDGRFRDNGVLDTRSKLVFTDLQIEEPADGPVARNLSFPAPMDAVIKALRDPDGSITFPNLRVPIEHGQLNRAAVKKAVVGALGPILATAIASAPIKLAGSAAEIVGLGGLLGGGQKKGPQPVTIDYAPGSIAVDPFAQAQLASLLDLAERDKNMQLTVRHELGGGDVGIAALRANPSIDDARVMAEQLRARKIALLDRRAQLAGRVRAQVAWLPSAQSESAVAELRDLDRQIAQTEQSLDQLYDLLRPGADRQADRRTRAASVQMARDRLDNISGMLKTPALPNAADRVHSAGAAFNPTEGNEGGRIVVTPVSKGK